MRLIFLVDTVLPHINQCASVANAKNSISILQNLLIESNSGKDGLPLILITGSDNETWLQTNACVESFDENFSICVNANDFNKALSNLKGKRIEMDIDTQKHIIKCCHDNGHFQLPCFDSEEYPRPIDVRNEQDIVSKKISSSSLLLALNKVSFATANDELRPVMNGIHFDFKDYGLVIVASDGRVLAKNTDTTIKSDNSEIDGFNLPKKPSVILHNILNGDEKEVNLYFNERVVAFSNDDFFITTRLIEGRYPNYDSVIPKDNTLIATFRRNDFISALKRVLPMSNTSSNMVSVLFANQKITISAIDIDFSRSASETINCDYDDNEIKIGFNGFNLLSVLQTIDDIDVKVLMKEPNRACIFTRACDDEKTQYISLLMPLRID